MDDPRFRFDPSDASFRNPAGWTLQRVRPDGGGWDLTTPDGTLATHFFTDGGLYLAIDMAEEYINDLGSGLT